MSIRAVKWSEELKVGVRAFDRDHRALVEALNEVIHAVDAGMAVPELIGMIKGLAELTADHFMREEAFLRERGDPGLDAHAAEHRRLMTEIHAYVASLVAGDSIDEDFLHHFLPAWLIDHIIGVDKEYARWVKQAS